MLDLSELLVQVKMKKDNNSDTSLRERAGRKSSGLDKCFIFAIFAISSTADYNRLYGVTYTVIQRNGLFCSMINHIKNSCFTNCFQL